MVCMVTVSMMRGAQPWRCLWRGSVQITRTTRWRRMILQLRHIFLTDALTFMTVSSMLRRRCTVTVTVATRELTVVDGGGDGDGDGGA